MYSRTYIREWLKSLGYSWVRAIDSYDRFIGPRGCSLYVKNNYVSATGEYRELESVVPRTSSDSKGRPEWRGEDIAALLDALQWESATEIPPPGAERRFISHSVNSRVPKLEDHQRQTQSSRIPLHTTGIYIAYPTSGVLKPIFPNYKTKVNKQHTKVGVATDSFASRKQRYVSIFQTEVEFIPVVELPKDRLSDIERQILRKLSARYSRVGWAREWFATTDHDEIMKTIMEVVGR